MAESLRKHLIRGVLGTGSIGAVQKLLSLGTAVLLARVLGAESYGIYAFAMAAVSFIAIPTQLGLPQLLTRETSSGHTRGEWGLLRGLRRKAFQIAGSATLFSTFIIGGAFFLIADRVNALDRTVFALALLLIPLLVAIAVTSSFLRGLRHVLHAAWPMSVLLPGLYLLVLMGLIYSGGLSPQVAVAANIAATIVALLASVFLLLRFWPAEARKVLPEYRTSRWFRSLVPFGLLAGISIINQKTDILMLGTLMTSEDVGIYNIVVQGGMLVSFSLAAFNAVLGPNVARLHAGGEISKLQRLVTLATAGMSAVAIVTAVILMVFGQWLLTNVFGESFGRGYNALTILVFGQLFNAVMGSVGLFLSMSGHEQDTLKAIALSAVLNVVLNLLLIPPLGITGAAIATTTSVVCWNIVLGIRLYQRLGIIPGPLGDWLVRKSR